MVLLVALFALTMGAGTASAQWAGPTLKSVLVTADSTQLAAVAAQANAVYTQIAGEAFAANDTITITLSGGATFSGTAVTLQSDCATVDLGGGVNTAAPPLSGGQAGDTTATWRVVDPTGSAAGDTLTLNAVATIFDVTGVTNGADVDLVMTMATVAGLPIGTARSFEAQAGNYVFSGIPAETVTLTTASNIADVAATTGAFTKFTGDTLNGTATVLSFKNDAGAATIPNIAVAANKVLFTLTGDFTGIDQVTCAAGTCTGSSSAGSIVGGTANEFLIGTGVAYAVNTAAVAAGATIALAPTFILDGTTAQSARSFTAKVASLGDTGNWTAHVAMDTASIYSITKNGVTRYAYNVPNASNVDGAFIRVINTSTQAGKIYGTLTGEDGAVIGTANTTLITSLAAGATEVLTAPELEALFGTWTGRARLTIDAEVPTLEAYCLIRAANGTLTNLSPVAP